MQPPTPFTAATSDAQAKACSRAAEDLAANRPRTHEERLELAKRVRLVLLAAAQRITPSGSWFSRPAAGREDQVFLTSLREVHTQRQREIRYRALLQAAEWALGDQAQAWLRDACRDDLRVCGLAVASDEGLEEALEELGRAAKHSRAR